jgi:hypothetical protein
MGLLLPAACGDVDPSKPPVELRITEIMYHPVLEEYFEDRHEFVEIHNPSEERVELTGFRLGGDITFAFPEGSAIEGGAYLVVAKDRARLLALPYAADPELVLGDYVGELDNGGGTVALHGPEGEQPMDSVTYSDGFPWPLAADALGAGERWLRAEWRPLEAHRYRGVSLERVSVAHPTNLPANWAPSPLDGATPTRARAEEVVADDAGTRTLGLPSIVTALDVRAAEPRASEPEWRISSGDTVRVLVSMSGELEPEKLAVEYFVDDVAHSDEVPSIIPLVGENPYSAELPPQPANSIVRYRVVGDRGLGLESISPRPLDPHGWHGYFVSPELDTQSRVYHLFISPTNWTALWDNIQDGRVSGCTVSPTWNEQVPAVFVHDGQVWDVFVRYHGSRWNRFNGEELSSWGFPGPARPNPLRALSFRIAFPRYARFEKKQVVVLNKLNQGCPGYTASVGFELFRQAGVPAPATRYVRLQVNGGYYHYMQELEHVGERTLEQFHKGEAGSGQPEPLGHLLKASGYIGDEGPWGWGDGRLLEPHCGYSVAERYAATYDRETHKWSTSESLAELIEGLHAARAQGVSELRTYLGNHFEVERVIDYLAVINWTGPWDDIFQNYFLYQRRSTGKWFMIPWDMDRTFGGYQGHDASIFLGEEGDPHNRDGLFNYFKSAFLETYRDEYVARLRALNGSLLRPENVNGLLDRTVGELDLAEAKRAPAGLACDAANEAKSFREYVIRRHYFVGTQ